MQEVRSAAMNVLEKDQCAVRYCNTCDDVRCLGFQLFVIIYFKKFHIFVTSFDERDDGPPPTLLLLRRPLSAQSRSVCH